MISHELHAAMERWLRIDTWHTNHPLDEERFFDALLIAESEGPRNFNVDHFLDVAHELVEKHHPKFNAEFRDEVLSGKAISAETIMSYLQHSRR